VPSSWYGPGRLEVATFRHSIPSLPPAPVHDKPTRRGLSQQPVPLSLSVTGRSHFL
jgi:hypothetical protein